MPLATPSENVLARAKELQLEQKLSFWDAVLVASCLDAGVERLYTEDLPGSKVPGLDIVNPFN